MRREMPEEFEVLSTMEVRAKGTALHLRGETPIVRCDPQVTFWDAGQLDDDSLAGGVRPQAAAGSSFRLQRLDHSVWNLAPGV